MKIGLFYGSTTCYTEMAAEKIRTLIGEDLVDIHNVKETPLSLMADYDLLLLGISTWYLLFVVSHNTCLCKLLIFNLHGY